MAALERILINTARGCRHVRRRVRQARIIDSYATGDGMTFYRWYGAILYNGRWRWVGGTSTAADEPPSYWTECEFDRAAHCRYIGVKGGQTTLKRHGRDHMSHIAFRGYEVTVARYFAGDEAAYRRWFVACGAYAYWSATGLPMKRNVDGRPLWPEKRPLHPAHTVPNGQRGLFEEHVLQVWQELPF